MKILKVSAALLILLFFVQIQSQSQDYSPFQMLKINSSARATAMGGCFEAMPDDPSAVYFNPATISTINNTNDKHFSSTFFKHVLDINSGLVNYVWTQEKIGILATSISYTNYGSFKYADLLGNLNGSDFGANDVTIAGTYSNKLDTNLYYGATVKFLFLSLEHYTTSAFALDAGLIYQIPEKRVNIGLSFLHAGSQITTFDGTHENLPFDIRLGINHRLKGLPLLVCFSLHNLADTYNNFFDKFLNFSLGGELYIGDYLMARLGYDNQIRRLTSPDTRKSLAGISAGVGIKLKDYCNIDYGLMQTGVSALIHKFTLNMNL